MKNKNESLSLKVLATKTKTKIVAKTSLFKNSTKTFLEAFNFSGQSSKPNYELGWNTMIVFRLPLRGSLLQREVNYTNDKGAYL